MHEALHHAVREVKTYFPYDTISATQVGFDRVQIEMPEAALDDLVHMLNRIDGIQDLQDELSAADKHIAELQSALVEYEDERPPRV